MPILEHFFVGHRLINRPEHPTVVLFYPHSLSLSKLLCQASINSNTFVSSLYFLVDLV